MQNPLKIQEIQKHLISLKRGRKLKVLRKFINFSKYASTSYCSTEKKQRKRMMTPKTQLRSLRLAGAVHACLNAFIIELSIRRPFIINSLTFQQLVISWIMLK